MFTSDFIINGQRVGDVGERFHNQYRFEPRLLRPFVGRDGKAYVTVKTGRQLVDNKTGKSKPEYRTVTVNDARHHGFDIPMDVTNATSLRKDEWIKFDEAVVMATRQRLRAWTDLASANSYGGFDGMSKTILEHETQSDPGEAMVDMHGTTEGRNDAPLYKLEGMPLPITHADFFIKHRTLMQSRNMGSPLDTTTAEAAGRRVAEQIEKSVIGTVTPYAYGVSTAYSQTSKVYGYTTHPARNTKTDVTTPTGVSTNATTVSEVLGMIKTLNDDGFYGPFMMYHSTDWAPFMDADYSANKGDNTLRDRLKKIDSISDVRQLDFLTSTFTLILVQMTADVARAINGMDITTLRWETRGGMQINYKVMAIQVPQIRDDYNNNCGIMHATTA